MTDPRAPGPITDAAGDGVETTGQNAAQGRRGTQMLKVLGASLLLVVVVFLVLSWVSHRGLSTNQGSGGQSGTNNPTAAAEFHQDAPTAKPNPPANATN